ncbi:MAG TPA: carbohydrate kinase family protein [Dehalococcoidia bacterium]|nr:carbohydrate kinase family protein [Dehalococcoidia bacterium]
MNSIEVIGLGALNMDHVFRVERILDDGETVVDDTLSSPGGSAANTICGLARLGVPAGFVGAIGDDAEGRLMLQDFEQVGVDVAYVRVKPGTKTGSVLCLSDSLGRRSLYVVPGANDRLTADDIDLDYVDQAKILHISSFAGDRQLQVLRELMERLDLSVDVSFTPGALFAARGIEVLQPILGRTRLLFINSDELRQLTGQDVIPGAETCLKQGCRVVVVTLGKGMVLETTGGTKVNTVAYIKDAEHEYVIEHSVQGIAAEADTIGAGDAFASGFLYGLLNDKGLDECGRLGDITARFAIGELGARQGLPTSSQLWQRYDELFSGG